VSASIPVAQQAVSRPASPSVPVAQQAISRPASPNLLIPPPSERIAAAQQEVEVATAAAIQPTPSSDIASPSEVQELPSSPAAPVDAASGASKDQETPEERELRRARKKAENERRIREHAERKKLRQQAREAAGVEHGAGSAEQTVYQEAHEVQPAPDVVNE